MTLTTVWKAQWPLGGAPNILIYEADTPANKRRHFIHWPATAELRRSLFDGRFVKVFFEGRIDDKGVLQCGRFVRQNEWVEG